MIESYILFKYKYKNDIYTFVHIDITLYRSYWRK
jgi:hypothetical protein